MVVLFDTNMIAEILIKNTPYIGEVQRILEKCASHEVEGWIAAHTLSDLYYILRKAYSPQERKRIIRDLCAIFSVSALDDRKFLAAAEKEGFTDLENCLQEECAYQESADYIITQNPSGFPSSRIPIIQPDKFLALLSES